MVDKASNRVEVQDQPVQVVHVRSAQRRKSFTGSDKRQWKRRRIVWMGKMRIGGYEVDVQVSDISLGGAKIRLDLPLKEGAQVTLFHEKFGTLEGKVVWQSDGQLGLAFNADPAAVAQTLGQSAVVLGLA